MKCSWTACATVSLFSLIPVVSAQSAGRTTPRIIWAEDLAAAHAQSRKAGRPVVAYFTFDT